MHFPPVTAALYVQVCVIASPFPCSSCPAMQCLATSGSVTGLKAWYQYYLWIGV